MTIRHHAADVQPRFLLVKSPQIGVWMGCLSKSSSHGKNLRPFILEKISETATYVSKLKRLSNNPYRLWYLIV